MDLSEEFREQAKLVFDVIINGAVRFIEEQELGSFVPMWKFNQALAGVGANINLKAIQDRMRERHASRGIYIIKGQGGYPAGMLVISNQALESVNAVHTRAPRPRDAAAKVASAS